MDYSQRYEYEQQLLTAISKNKQRIYKLQQTSHNLWGGEDAIYRFYHESFKTYRIQDLSKSIINLIKDLLPLELNKMLLKIIEEGTGKEFNFNSPNSWYEDAKPMVDTFLHLRHILDMIVKYGLESDDSDRKGNMGWFTVLYVYKIR